MRRGGLLRPFKLIRKNMLESTKMLGVKHQIAIDIFIFVHKLGQIIMYRSDAGARRCLVGFIASGSGFQWVPVPVMSFRVWMAGCEWYILYVALSRLGVPLASCLRGLVRGMFTPGYSCHCGPSTKDGIDFLKRPYCTIPLLEHVVATSQLQKDL